MRDWMLGARRARRQLVEQGAGGAWTLVVRIYLMLTLPIYLFQLNSTDTWWKRVWYVSV
jgi:hypothetical protein